MSDVDCVLEPTLVAYIERKKLECLLKKLFKRDIVVYEKNERYYFKAPRELTEEELETVTEDSRVSN